MHRRSSRTGPSAARSRRYYPHPHADDRERLEEGNDADTLRSDPMFKLAMGRLPDDADLCSQPTISRFEKTPDVRALLHMSRAMIDQYCESFRRVPKHIVIEIDATFDAVHCGQQLRLFNAHFH